MKILKPIRGELIAVLPIFTKICPLARPRLNYHRKSVYQPLENQKPLLSITQAFEPLEIAFPVIVDSFSNFERAKKQKTPTRLSDGDEDNLRKAINDALQFGKIIVDDRFVIGGENYKWFSDEDCCLVKIYSIEGEEEVEF